VRKIHFLIAFWLILALTACQGGTEETSDLLEAGRAHLEAGEYEKAISALESAVEQSPDNSDAHFLLGQAYNQTGKLLEAADEFRAVLKINPESAAAHHNLGVTYYQLQQLDAARAEFEADRKSVV